jgi:hypothetical protein
VQVEKISMPTTADLFLTRYNPLYGFWLADLWDLPPDLLRARPHPQVNSIAWNLWHLTRVEDAGLNRFVADRPQVLDDRSGPNGDWAQRMNVPWRHHGGGMTLAEVDELNAVIDLETLRAYSAAVAARTRAIVADLDQIDLDRRLEEPHLRQVLFAEGLAHQDAGGLLQNYLGWTKAQCLFNLGLTHSYQHVGEIGVIATLLGITFD